MIVCSRLCVKGWFDEKMGEEVCYDIAFLTRTNDEE